MVRTNRNASPSASTRHTRAPTLSRGPAGGTISRRTVVPVFSRALVLTFAPCLLMSTVCDRYRLAPASTTTGHKTLLRTSCRRSCCGWGIVTEGTGSKPRADPTGLWNRWVARVWQGNCSRLSCHGGVHFLTLPETMDPGRPGLPGARAQGPVSEFCPSCWQAEPEEPPLSRPAARCGQYSHHGRSAPAQRHGDPRSPGPPRMTMRYQHLTPEHLQDAMRALDRPSMGSSGTTVSEAG